MIRRSSLLVLAALLVSSCARVPKARSPASGAVLVAPDGSAWRLSDHLSESPATVVIFFSSTCPCQAAHDARLVELADLFRRRGIRFYAVDSERGASPERDAAEARARGYPFPILIDPRGELARDLGAEYATYTVVIDRGGHIAYRGGIDTDRKTLHTDATPYLRDVLEDLVSGNPPRLAEGEALGCTLHRW